ncbi:hypothetical protein BGX26_004054 [Mortierella sp. AD094]|nr:hypothetical protein BGX26_004054 [Mortierella sp. AD094]
MSASSSKLYLERSSVPATVLLHDDHSLSDDIVSCCICCDSSVSDSDDPPEIRRHNSNCPRAAVAGQDDTQTSASHSQLQEDISYENAGPSKYHRTAITLKEKLAIIDHAERHPNKTVADVSRDFAIPRTTVHGILNKKELFRSQAYIPAMLGASRVPKRHHPSPVDKLVRCMQGRINPVLQKPKKDVVSNRQPEPPVLCDPRPGLVSSPIERRRQLLRNYSYEDIFTFGVTRKYVGKVLNVSPEQCDRHVCRDGSVCSESSTFLTLLCANASGTYRSATPVIVKQTPMILESEACNGVVIYDKCAHLCSDTFQNWLSVADMGSQRRVLLVVDNATCDLLKTDKDSVDLPFLHTDVLGIPSGQSSSLQCAFQYMNSELEKLFNEQYATQLDTTSRFPTELACSSNEQRSEDFKTLVQKAWSQIPNKDISEPIQKFVKEVYSSQEESTTIVLCDFKQGRQSL